MTLGLAYWVLMLIWLVFGIVTSFGLLERNWGVPGNIILLFILFVLLGWQVFGPPLHK